MWDSIAGSSQDSQKTIISDETGGDAEEKPFLKKEVRKNSTLSESSLQCLSPSLSFESEDSESTKDSEDGQCCVVCILDQKCKRKTSDLQLSVYI